MEWLKDRDSGRRDAWKGVGASVLLHVAATAVVLFTISAAPPARPPLVIDLSIGGPWETEGPAVPAPSREPSRVGDAGPGLPPGNPALPAQVTPAPTAMPEPLPAPPKEMTPVASSPAPPDRQGGMAADRTSGFAGSIERAAAPLVSGGVSSAAAAAAGSSHGAFPSTDTSRATPGSGPRAGEPGGTGVQARGRYLEREYAYIRDAIQRGIAYPAMARKLGWEGKVVVAFLVLSDGSVRDVRVVQGSGHSALDRGAVEAVRKAAPFPRPPAEAEIITPVVYRLE